MANEPSDETGSGPLVGRTNSAPRHVLVAGIATACVLGAGAGLWARPADQDQRRPAAAAKARPSKPKGKLEIVLTDPLAPPHAAPAVQGPVVAAEIVSPDAEGAEALAPFGPPEGLVRVQQVEPEAEPVMAPAKKSAPPKAQKAKLQKKSQPKKAKKPDLKVAKAEPKPDTRLAAETGAEIDAADGKAPGRLSRLKSAIAKPFKARHKDEAEVAETGSKPAKPKKPAREVKLAKAEAKPAKKPSKRCVSSDPGAAIVCADPALAAADRQLTRAYHEAEAAGVPSWQLKQQQQRWLAARAAAAREAPWAVHDVYLARIAELNDLTRDARGY